MNNLAVLEGLLFVVGEDGLTLEQIEDVHHEVHVNENLKNNVLNSIPKEFNTLEKAVMFQSGWFVFGILSQTLIIHLIRTSKIPFIQSKSSKQLLISTFTIVVVTLVISFTRISTIFDLSRLPYYYLGWICILMVIYAVFIQVYKKIYIKNNKEWL